MSEKTKFTPIRGLEEIILTKPFTDGAVYFASDTGKIYLDCYDSSGLEKNKLSVGGGGVSLIYGNDPNPIAEDEEDEDNINFSLALSLLETKCHPNDLILNMDGCFYKVINIDDAFANCIRLAVSGSGSGGSGSIGTIDLYLDYDSNTFGPGYTYIYGAKTYAELTPRFTEGGAITLTFTIIDNTGVNANKTFTATNHMSGTKYKLDTSMLPLSEDLTISIRIHSINSLMPGQSRVFTFEGINTVEMGIKKPNNNYLALVPEDDASGNLKLNYIPIGSADSGIIETLHVYIDGEEDLNY